MNHQQSQISSQQLCTDYRMTTGIGPQLPRIRAKNANECNTCFRSCVMYFHSITTGVFSAFAVVHDLPDKDEVTSSNLVGPIDCKPRQFLNIRKPARVWQCGRDPLRERKMSVFGPRTHYTCPSSSPINYSRRWAIGILKCDPP